MVPIVKQRHDRAVAQAEDEGKPAPPPPWCGSRSVTMLGDSSQWLEYLIMSMVLVEVGVEDVPTSRL